MHAGGGRRSGQAKGSSQMSDVMSVTVATALMEVVREFSVPVQNERGEDVTSLERVASFEETGLLTRDAGFLVVLANGEEYQVTVKRSKQATDGDYCVECGMWFESPAGLRSHLMGEHGWDEESVDYLDVE